VRKPVSKSPDLSQKPIFFTTKNDEGQRVDNFLLKKLKSLSKSNCYKLIRKGQVRVNGKRIKPVQKIKLGDQVRVPPFLFFDNPSKTHVVPEQVKQQILRHIIFEDADYLVLNKPAGLPCHSGTGHEYGLIEIITAVKAYTEVQLAHRLDKDTSGCLLLAKNRTSLLAFQQLLKQKEVKKSYLAVLVGRLIESVVVEQPLDTEHRVKGIRHVIVSPSGYSAQTSFEPQKSHAKYTLVECQITSGRTHQVRVHAQHIGHSVLGDCFYGKKRPDLARQLYLHAHQLQFGMYSFEVSMPVDFEQVMAAI